MSISDAFVLYDLHKLHGKTLKTRKNYRSTLNSFVKCWGDIPVELITVNSVAVWKQEMAYRGKQTSSMGSNLSHLREVLKYLKRHGYDVIDYWEVDRPTIKRKAPTWLQVEEVGALLSVIESPRDKAIVACLYSTGARISELLSLNRDSIENGVAEIIGKGDKPGTLDFDDNALEYLNTYLETRRDKLHPLFVSGQRRRITVSRVEQLIHEYADLAGIEKNVTPHVLRHSFASNLKLNGADIYDIQKQMRHSSISTSQIYVHIEDKKKQQDYKTYHSKVPLV